MLSFQLAGIHGMSFRWTPGLGDGCGFLATAQEGASVVGLYIGETLAGMFD